MFFPLLSEPWSHLSPGYIAFFALMLSIGYEVQAHPPEGTQVLCKRERGAGGGVREKLREDYRPEGTEVVACVYSEGGR